MRILLADHSKFDRRALYAMGSLREFDLVIVDDALPAARVADMRARGIKVEVARGARAES